MKKKLGVFISLWKEMLLIWSLKGENKKEAWGMGMCMGMLPIMLLRCPLQILFQDLWRNWLIMAISIINEASNSFDSNNESNSGFSATPSNIGSNTASNLESNPIICEVGADLGAGRGVEVITIYQYHRLDYVVGVVGKKHNLDGEECWSLAKYLEENI